MKDSGPPSPSILHAGYTTAGPVCLETLPPWVNCTKPSLSLHLLNAGRARAHQAREHGREEEKQIPGVGEMQLGHSSAQHWDASCLPCLEAKVCSSQEAPFSPGETGAPGWYLQRDRKKWKEKEYELSLLFFFSFPFFKFSFPLSFSRHSTYEGKKAVWTASTSKHVLSHHKRHRWLFFLLTPVEVLLFYHFISL